MVPIFTIRGVLAPLYTIPSETVYHDNHSDTLISTLDLLVIEILPFVSEFV